MTLRSRLAVSLLIAVLAVGTSFGVLALRQHQVLTEQIDIQLVSTRDRLERAIEMLTPEGAMDLVPEPVRTSEAYVGSATADGTLTTVAEPVSQPELTPAIDPTLLDDLAGGPPATVDAATGSGQLRVVVSRFGDVFLVVGLSTEEVSAAMAQLGVTAAVCLGVLAVIAVAIVLWVDRMGLRPIRSVTRVADAVTAGRRAQRVAVRSPGTEAGRLGDAFNLMLDANEQAESRLRQFVADASHELRTPLTTLAGYTDLYVSGGLADEEKLDDAMRRINAEARRMTVLAEDLRRLAEMDEGRNLAMRPLEAGRLVADVVADAAVVQPARPLAWEAADSLWVRGDPDRLHQALAILVDNALCHTSDADAVTVSGRVAGDEVVLTVSDDGPGVAAEDLPHIFDRFYRADRGLSRPGGSGLGLPIAKAIVEAHHGHLTAYNRPDGGAAFEIRLPLATPHDAG